MSKIVALNAKHDNEDDDNESMDGEELMLTREALETIAESEYIRAITLLGRGNSEACLNLLRELIQTQVLNENIEKKDNTNKKLWLIKYNCHRNIATILERKLDLNESLQHYIKAIQIDNTDVHTLYKLGKLALQLNALDIAEYAFENCLARNTQHRPAAEGILQVYARQRHITSAYHWAVLIYNQNPHCSMALEILWEIVVLMGDNLESIERMTVPLPESIRNDLKLFDSGGQKELSFKWMCDTSKMQIVDQQTSFNAAEQEKIKELRRFRIRSDFNWLELGNFILRVCEHFKETGQNLLFNFTMDDVVEREESSNEMTMMDCNPTKDEINGLETQNASNSAGEFSSPKSIENGSPTAQNLAGVDSDGNRQEEMDKGDLVILVDNDDSNSNAKSDSSEAVTAKPKSKRRCSDLHFLEQWGWHKNRKYTSRKKSDRDEVDTTLNGFLRKAFSKYIAKSFTDKWPFQKNPAEESGIGGSDAEANACKHCPESLDEGNFNEKTVTELNQLKDNLMNRPLDMMELVHNWLKYFSLLWKFKLPTSQGEMYLKIFNIYLDNFDLLMWSLSDAEELESSYRLCLLYLELAFKEHHSDNWQGVFRHLVLNLVFYQAICDNARVCRLRLIFIDYATQLQETDHKKCLSCVQEMLATLEWKSDGKDFCLHLPNLLDFCINKNQLQKLCKDYSRIINIHRIPKLFEDGVWPELCEIIVNNIETSSDQYENENWLKDYTLQMQMLLQAYWQSSLFDACLLWCEKCFHYIVSHYVEETKIYRQKQLLELINFITSYLEAIILNQGFHIVQNLSEDDLSRLIQNIIRLMVHHLEGNVDKTNTQGEDLDFKRCWIILHQIILMQENTDPSSVVVEINDQDDVNNLIPNSFLLLFTAHEFLGRRQWCTNDNGELLLYTLDTVAQNIKAPIYDACRDVIYEYVEQVTYCLYKYPQRKARSRHLKEHEAKQLKLTWPRAVQIFDLYRPENLPEFNSYKLESITSDMEQLFLKIIALLPKEYNPCNSMHLIMKFIYGKLDTLPTDNTLIEIPYKIRCIFYLLADFYFKNRDFAKAIKYYTMDLTIATSRFDSWAGMALSKASRIETKLNALEPIVVDVLWSECEEVLRCFDCCVKLNQVQTLLWIEYGSFSYSLHSFFSRYLKHHSENLSMEKFSAIEEKKSKMLNLSYSSFSYVTKLLNNANRIASDVADSSDVNDEKWLCHYMLGKIAEKRKEDPKVYLNHYLMSANYLYESSATYPIKIHHSNPTTLSVEALEIFYRMNAAIIKFIEHENEISRTHGELFCKVLKDLSVSPFAFNKAKVDGNSINIIKGRLLAKGKSSPNGENKTQSQEFKDNNAVKLPTELPVSDAAEVAGTTSVGATRRTSQESLGTNTNTVTSSNSSASSETWSSDSSDSDSNGGGDNATEAEPKVSASASVSSQKSKAEGSNRQGAGSCSSRKLKNIYRMVIQNIEECITRFPEHYKSRYRLIYHYMYSTRDYQDYEKCEQLLMGQYRTTLGNVLYGLFHERKMNNLFNGIWRIPSSEIDRPGSFSAHLVKCVNILIEMLLKREQFKVLMDISLSLHRTPDVDKRYIQDGERKELHQLAVTHCVQILRGLFQNFMEKHADNEMLDLLLDIYKIHKKCMKYMNYKEAVFAQLLIDVYKLFIQDKVDYIPENANFLDLAIKFSVQEIGAQKREKERLQQSEKEQQTDDVIIVSSSSNAPRTYYIPGLSMRPKVRPVMQPTKPAFPYNSGAIGNRMNEQPTMPNLLSSLSQTPGVMARNEVPGQTPLQQQLPTQNPLFNLLNNPLMHARMFEEYYAKLVRDECQKMAATMIATSSALTSAAVTAATTSSMGQVGAVPPMGLTTGGSNLTIRSATPTPVLSMSSTNSVTSIAATMPTDMTITPQPTILPGNPYPQAATAKMPQKAKSNGKRNGSKPYSRNTQEGSLSSTEVQVSRNLLQLANTAPANTPSLQYFQQSDTKCSATSSTGGGVNMTNISLSMEERTSTISTLNANSMADYNTAPSIPSSQKTLVEKLIEMQRAFQPIDPCVQSKQPSSNTPTHLYQQHLPSAKPLTQQKDPPNECVEVIVLD